MGLCGNFAAISSQWRSGWISFIIKVCKGTWSCTDEHDKPGLFLEFTLIPDLFRFSKKLDNNNMSRDIQTCKGRLEWTRNFLVRIPFFIDPPLHYKFFFVHNFAIISNLSFCFCLCSFFLFLFVFVFFFLFFFYINFTSQSRGFTSRIELNFHLIQPILSALAAAQDEMKRARTFKLTVTVIDRWREILDSQELPRLFLIGLSFSFWIACAVVNLGTFSKIQQVAFKLNKEIFLRKIESFSIMS